MAVPEPKLRDIFSKAAECRTAEEQAVYLDQACQGNAELRSRLEELLEAHREAGSFLQEPSAAGAGPANQRERMTSGPTVESPIGEGPGTVIGPYKLIEQIGEGGMGTVWMAQQTEPVKRMVALKLIKAGMDSKQVIARFEAERQALALMDHPNIARVLDGGTVGQDSKPAGANDGFGSLSHVGRPYFVMDLVKGVPITKYCDEHHLTPRQRLELFLHVCQAVQHAHQKGIIHRDLKPSNVLVALYDGKPVPKVIDFGVAKAAGQSLTEKTLVTAFGNIVGTLEYMSPEQAEINQLDIDTRSDIYSLGVLLYELLTGSPPFTRKELEKAGMLEMLRVIREEEPSKPSTKLSTADGLPTLAANRGTEPAKLTRLVRGELDWIVMKALEKDRNRRYETANGFAMDVQRYLADEAVQAGPPSAWYRFRKFARRHRGPLGTAAVVAAALILAVVGLLVSNVVVTQERNEKVAALAQSQANFEAAEANLQLALKAVENYLNHVTADPDLKHKADLHPLRQKLLAAAMPFYQQFVKQHSGNPYFAGELGAAYLRLARVRSEMGDRHGAIADYEQARGIYSQLVVDRPDFAGYRGNLGQCYHGLASLLADLGRHEEARSAYTQALSIWRQLVAESPDDRQHRDTLAMSLSGIGALERKLGRLPQALEAYKEALAIGQKLADDFPGVPEYRKRLAGNSSNWAVLLFQSGQREEALALFRQVVDSHQKLVDDFPTDPEHRKDLAVAHNNYGILLVELGRPEQGLRAWQAALPLLEKLSGDWPSVPTYRQTLGISYANLGKLLRILGCGDDARIAYEKALAIEGKLVAGFPAVQGYVVNLALSQGGQGLVLRDLGQPDAALTSFDEAIRNLEPVLAKQPKLALAREAQVAHRHGRALTLNALGRHTEAIREWDQAIAQDQGAARRVLQAGRGLSLALSGGAHADALTAAMALPEDKNIDAEMLYATATACALASATVKGDTKIRDQYAAAAITLARQAALKGAPTALRLKHDSAFSSLHERPDFQMLVAELETREKQGNERKRPVRS